MKRAGERGDDFCSLRNAGRADFNGVGGDVDGKGAKQVNASKRSAFHRWSDFDDFSGSCKEQFDFFLLVGTFF